MKHYNFKNSVRNSYPQQKEKSAFATIFLFTFTFPKKTKPKQILKKSLNMLLKKGPFTFFFFKMQAPGTQNSSDLLCHTASFLHFTEVKPTIYSIPQNYNALK